MIRSLFLVSFFLISCNNDSSEVAISKDIDFNIIVNDYKLVDSDSLQVKLSYYNPDLNNIEMRWSTNDIINQRANSLNIQIISKGIENKIVELNQI